MRQYLTAILLFLSSALLGQIETFPTVLEASGITYLGQGALVKTEGYFGVGDGGGALYKVTAAANIPGVVDLGYVYPMTNGDYLVQVMDQPWINTATFGIVCGNTAQAASNYTRLTRVAAVANALDYHIYMRSCGDTIYVEFPANDTITINNLSHKHLIIAGDGEDATVLKSYNSVGEGWFKFSDPDRVSFFDMTVVGYDTSPYGGIGGATQKLVSDTTAGWLTITGTKDTVSLKTGQATPDGPDRSIQFNSGGSFTGSDSLKYENDSLKLEGATLFAYRNIASGSANTLFQFDYDHASYNPGAITAQQYYHSVSLGFISGTNTGSIGLQNSTLSLSTQNVGTINLLSRYASWQPSLTGGYFRFLDNTGVVYSRFDNNTKSLILGADIAPTARLQVRGAGITSATNAMLVEDFAGNPIVEVEDNRTAKIFGDLRVYRTTGTEMIQVSSSAGIIDVNPDQNSIPKLRVRNTTNAHSLYAGGNLQGVGINTIVPTASLHVTGAGTTSATTALKVDNSGGLASLTVDDEQKVIANKYLRVATTVLNSQGLYPVPAMIGFNSAVDRTGLVITDNTSSVTREGALQVNYNAANSASVINTNRSGLTAINIQSGAGFGIKMEGEGGGAYRSLQTIGSGVVSDARYGHWAHQYYQNIGAGLTASGDYVSFGSSGQHATAGSDVTNVIDFQARQFSTTGNGTVTNRYGLKIDFTNANITNPWGVYVGNAGVKNHFNGQLAIGTTTPDASSLVDITSTTQGFLPPRQTTGQRDAIATPAEGLFLYNTTTQHFSGRDASSWRDLAYTSDIDSTRLLQDSILLYYVNNIEIGRDTIRVPGGAGSGDPDQTLAWNGTTGEITISGTGGNIIDIDGRYLESFTETDPIYSGDPASGILAGDITNWNNAFGWGDHALEGYLTAEADGDPANELQTITLDSVTGTYNLALSDGGGSVKIARNTDAQTLSITSNNLSITGGNSVSLVPYLDNTDNQVISIDSNATTYTLLLEDGGTAKLAKSTNTDAQTLSWNGGTGEVSITGGNTVDIDGRYLQSESQVLSVDSTTSTYEIGISPGNDITIERNQGRFTPIRSTGANYTTALSDVLIISNGHTITLSSSDASISGRRLVVKNASGFNITVDTEGAQTIDSGASVTIASLGARTFASNGSNWYIVSSF